MKRFKLKWVTMAVFAVALSGLGWFGIAQAQTITATVGKGKTVDSSVYSAGKSIRIQGTVNGDVYCAGQDVVIDGTVKGDVLCAAQTIKITGTVEGSVRVAGQDVLISGPIGRSLTVASDRTMIDKDATIGQDATLAGSTVDMSGTITRDATIAAARATVAGSINRHLAYNGNTLSINDSGRVKGGVTYQSEKSISIADKAQVTGEVTRKKDQQQGSGNRWIVTLTIFIAMLLFAVLLAVCFPQVMHRTSEAAVRSLGRVLLIGVLSAVVIPVSIIFLVATLVGIPIALFILLCWFLAMLLSGPIAGYYLGSMILSKAKNPIIIMLFGASLLLVLYSVPIVSFFAILLAYLIGIGCIVSTLKRRVPKPSYSVE